MSPMATRTPLLARARDLLLGAAAVMAVIGLGASNTGTTLFNGTWKPITPATVVTLDSDSSPEAPRSGRIVCACGWGHDGGGVGTGLWPFKPNTAKPWTQRAPSADHDKRPRPREDFRPFLDSMARAARARTSIGIADEAEGPIWVDDGAKHDQ